MTPPANIHRTSSELISRSLSATTASGACRIPALHKTANQATGVSTSPRSLHSSSTSPNPAAPKQSLFTKLNPSLIAKMSSMPATHGHSEVCFAEKPFARDLG
jgi:hypothetical protein